MAWQTTIHLQPSFFSEAEKTLAEYGGLTASTFKYSTGVLGLRLTNRLGQITMLPYQGQQIWHCEFYGRTLTMQSMFPEPNPTTEYLKTYGAFLIHCGAATMGVPTDEDDHGLHGELPNAPFQTAALVVGEDEGGAYMGLTGSYTYTVAFTISYVARPLLKLYANSSLMPASINIENLTKADMDLMYMAHVNFRPVDHGKLVYSAHSTPEHIRVRRSIPSHVKPDAQYLAFLDELEVQPDKHNTLSPNLSFNPEVVFYIDYLADANGWAHSLQVHPDGSADYIRHQPAELDKGVRWISRTGDQDALGLNLPATAEPEGYTAEKAKGNIRTLPAGQQVTFSLEAGALTADEASAMAEKIQRIIAEA